MSYNPLEGLLCVSGSSKEIILLHGICSVAQQSCLKRSSVNDHYWKSLPWTSQYWTTARVSNILLLRNSSLPTASFNHVVTLSCSKKAFVTPFTRWPVNSSRIVLCPPRYLKHIHETSRKGFLECADVIYCQQYANDTQLYFSFSSKSKHHV